MDANQLRAKLNSLQRLVDQQDAISDDQRKDIIRLREQVHRLTGDKETLEAERQKLSHQLSTLTQKLGSK